MVKLRTALLQTNLYQQTPFRSKLDNNTRWNFTNTMLRIHVEIGQHVAFLDDENLDPYLLNALAKRKVDTLAQNLSELNEVVLKLKSNDSTLHQSRIYFDSERELYPLLEALLISNACIVHSPQFESEVVYQTMSFLCTHFCSWQLLIDLTSFPSTGKPALAAWRVLGYWIPFKSERFLEQNFTLPSQVCSLSTVPNHSMRDNRFWQMFSSFVAFNWRYDWIFPCSEPSISISTALSWPDGKSAALNLPFSVVAPPFTVFLTFMRKTKADEPAVQCIASQLTLLNDSTAESAFVLTIFEVFHALNLDNSKPFKNLYSSWYAKPGRLGLQNKWLVWVLNLCDEYFQRKTAGFICSKMYGATQLFFYYILKLYIRKVLFVSRKTVYSIEVCYLKIFMLLVAWNMARKRTKGLYVACARSWTSVLYINSWHEFEIKSDWKINNSNILASMTELVQDIFNVNSVVDLLLGNKYFETCIIEIYSVCSSETYRDVLFWMSITNINTVIKLNFIRISPSVDCISLTTIYREIRYIYSEILSPSGQ